QIPLDRICGAVYLSIIAAREPRKEERDASRSAAHVETARRRNGEQSRTRQGPDRTPRGVRSGGARVLRALAGADAVERSRGDGMAGAENSGAPRGGLARRARPKSPDSRPPFAGRA